MRGVPVHRQPGFRQFAGRFDDIGPIPTAELRQRQRHAFDVAGHRYRQRPVDVGVVGHLRPVEGGMAGGAADQRIVLGAGGQRCAHAELHNVHAILGGAIDGHVATAADAAHPRFHRTKGKPRRDCRIDGIAAPAQHVCAHFRSHVVLRGHQAAPAENGGLADLPVFGGWLGDRRRALRHCEAIIGTAPAILAGEDFRAERKEHCRREP